MKPNALVKILPSNLKSNTYGTEFINKVKFSDH